MNTLAPFDRKHLMTLRIASAYAAVKRYPTYNKQDLQGSIIDLIVDLYHLADAHKIDLDVVEQRFIAHYESERIGDANN